MTRGENVGEKLFALRLVTRNTFVDQKINIVEKPEASISKS